MRSAVGRQDFRTIASQRGLSDEQLARMADDISAWANSEDSVAAFAECTVIGLKP
jgi:hypothetical protein